MSQILFDIKVGSAESQYYGRLILSNMRYEDGSMVNINKFLGVLFISPAAVSEVDFTYSLNPWEQIKPEINAEQINDSTFAITAKLSVRDYTFNSDSILDFGINGDLTENPERYTKSFQLAADQLPDTHGAVNVGCAAAPDPALASYKQALTFTYGARVNLIEVPLGATTTSRMATGTYTVTAAELTTPEQTVVAAAKVSPSTVTVAIGEMTAVNVTYGAVTNT